MADYILRIIILFILRFPSIFKLKNNPLRTLYTLVLRGINDIKFIQSFERTKRRTQADKANNYE